MGESGRTDPGHQGILTEEDLAQLGIALGELDSALLRLLAETRDSSTTLLRSARRSAAHARKDRMSKSGVVEAVIISGPRRGEIVSIGPEFDETLSEKELALLTGALQDLNVALSSLVERTTALSSCLRAATEEMRGR